MDRNTLQDLAMSGRSIPPASWWVGTLIQLLYDSSYTHQLAGGIDRPQPVLLLVCFKEVASAKLTYVWTPFSVFPS